MYLEDIEQLNEEYRDIAEEEEAVVIPYAEHRSMKIEKNGPWTPMTPLRKGAPKRQYRPI